MHSQLVKDFMYASDTCMLSGFILGAIFTTLLHYLIKSARSNNRGSK
jgi:hypothetical protein